MKVSASLPLLLHKPHPDLISQLFVQVPTYFLFLLLGKRETQYPDRLVFVQLMHTQHFTITNNAKKENKRHTHKETKVFIN